MKRPPVKKKPKGRKPKAVKAWALLSPNGAVWPPACSDKGDLSHWFREQYDEQRVIRVSIQPL